MRALLEDSSGKRGKVEGRSRRQTRRDHQHHRGDQRELRRRAGSRPAQVDDYDAERVQKADHAASLCRWREAVRGEDAKEVVKQTSGVFRSMTQVENEITETVCVPC